MLSTKLDDNTDEKISLSNDRLDTVKNSKNIDILGLDGDDPNPTKNNNSKGDNGYRTPHALSAPSLSGAVGTVHPATLIASNRKKRAIAGGRSNVLKSKLA